MAFATSNIHQVNLGGGLRILYGQWTGTVGDAPGSMTVQGGQLWLCDFQSNTSGDLYADEVPVTVASVSANNTMTLTIANNATVAAGTFLMMVT